MDVNTRCKQSFYNLNLKGTKMIYCKRLGQSDQSTSLITGKTKKMLCDKPLMSHKWPVPLTHTFMSTTHTRMCFSWQNLCRSASPFALNWVINPPTPPPFAFRQWACILFPEPKGLCSLLSQTYLRGEQVVHMHLRAHVCQCVSMRVYVGNVCMRMPPPHSHPSWFLCQNQFASRWQWNTAGKPPRRGMS